ncbi:enoyl-CoA hydratase/isomerase family protein [Massilia niastensis]|uniref:enoyl-CoA hydratase/isomerase family protein n=1 Tax=Massilia niastensis TaxID=544911 RepID=UPI00035F1CF3|nr:enoyl-CoA hydratase/isomerase family protein [Massilia niastensis]
MNALAAVDTQPGGAGALLVCREDAVTRVTLNRPGKLNALNVELVEALLAVVQESCRDGTRLLVLQGAGRNFSAGFDLGDVEAQSEGDLVLRFIRVEQLLQAVYHAPYQTMALAHGKNFGAGVDLVCACNQRIAAAGSTFRMPGLRFGLVLGTRRLVQRIGTDRAREVLARSSNFTADEAVTMGFIRQVSGQEAWPALVQAAADEASSLSLEAMAALLRVTAPDSREADLAELAGSASLPGLKERLRRYRAQT